MPYGGHGEFGYLVAAPGLLDFGDVLVGTPKQLNLLLTNYGDASLTFGVVTITGTGMSKVSGLTTGLAAGASRTWVMQFAPGGTGSITGSLTIYNSGEISPVLVALKGNGVAAGTGSIAVEPSQYDFGEVKQGDTAVKTFTISNPGTIDLHVSAINQVSFVAAGAKAAGIGAVTPVLPAGIAKDDVLLLVAESKSGEAVTIADSKGGQWTEVTNSPQDSTDSRLTVFWSRYNGFQEAPTTNDPGDHICCFIIAYRGCSLSGNPWNITVGGVDNVSNTALSATGGTTTVDGCLIVVIASTGADTDTPQYSGWTNTDLLSITERQDACTAFGDGGGAGLATGERVAAGAFGATTATLAGASTKGFLTIALRGNDPYSISGISLPATIAASGSTTFDLTFAPTALEEGVLPVTLSILSDATSSPTLVSVQGTAVVLIPAYTIPGLAYALVLGTVATLDQVPRMRSMDPSDLNCEDAASLSFVHNAWSLRNYEKVLMRIGIMYEDLGVATITVTVHTPRKSVSISVTLGTVTADSAIKRAFADLPLIQGELLSVQISRAANAGKLSILAVYPEFRIGGRSFEST